MPGRREDGVGDQQAGTEPRRIGITGSTGYIGTHLVTRAIEAGIPVRTFSRSAWEGAPFVPAGERRELLLPVRPDPSAFDGLDAVIHLAVAPHGSTEETSVAVNVLGTLGLYEAVRAAGVPRFIFISTQSAHDGARNRYGRTKREAERRIQGRPGAVIVRPGLAYDGGPLGLLGLASTAAAKVRAFPVMGGKDSIVQVIHLDDLCAALLALADLQAHPDVPELVELADPVLYPLGELVAATAAARFGVRPKLINIPLGLAKAGASSANALKVAEALSEVVDGIVAFRPMDTAPQLASLGIELRSFDAATFPRDDAYVPVTAAADAEGAPDGSDAKRLLLVGAGRIGSLHALCGRRHPDAVLCGIVDPSRQAVAQVRAVVGPEIPAFGSLDEALDVARADAAIVATPPSSHDPLAIGLLGRGIDVLIEKPVTPTAEARERLLAAAAEAQDRTGATAASGYHFLQLPHLRRAAERFRAGDFGTLTGFCALGFVSRAVERGKKLSWELDPERAGGGALPQVAAHALSVVDLFCGPLEVLDASLLSAPDRLVEDAAWVRLSAGSAEGSLFAGWHLSEFVIPENSVRFSTDRGLLVVSSASAVFFPSAGGEPEALTCLDERVGFDPTPNDAGGGFWLEQRALLRGQPDRNGLDAAAQIEGITTAAYGLAKRLRAGDTPGVPNVELRLPAPHHGGWVDVRRLTDPTLLAGAASTAGPDTRYVVGTSEFTALAGTAAELLLVVPDLPRIFRTMTNEGPVAVVSSLGAGNLLKAGLGLSPLGVVSPAGRLWQAMGALLRAEVAPVPRDFSGRVAIDGYLVDLAGGLGRFDELVKLVLWLRRRFPRAELGVDTNAPGLVRGILPVVARHIGFVLSIGAPGVDMASELRQAADHPDLDVLIKTGPQAHEVAAWAVSDPARWQGDGGQLVADWRGTNTFVDAQIDLLTRAVRGTGCPDDAFAEACELLGLARPTSG